MKIRRLGIDRLPGIDEKFEVSDLAEGFNIIVGPNEIGKSSLCRAARALWWSEHGPTDRLAVHALVDIDGESWRVVREGSRHEWKREGEPAAAPPLPPHHLHACFFLELLSLLEATETAGHDVAAAIRKQMAGGFDLDQVMSDAFAEIKRQPGRAERKKLDDAKMEIQRANQLQADLQRREDRLAELEAQVDVAAAAHLRRPHFATALELQRLRAERDDASRALDQLPSGLERLSGGEPDQLDQREGELEAKRQQRLDLDAARDTAHAARAATGLASGLDPGELTAWRDRADQLSRLEQELIQAREDREKQRAQVTEANRAIGARGPELPTIDIDDHVDLFAFLREAQSAAGRQEAIDERINLLENVEPTADGGPGIDRLRAGVDALRAWLRASAASPVRRVPVVVAVVLLVIGAAAAWLIHPLYSALGGFGLGLAVFILVARRDADALAARKVGEREFARQSLAPPSAWRDSAVDERLRDLESELAERAAAVVRADRRASEISDLTTRREALQGDLAAIEARRRELEARLGFGAGLPDADFVDLVRALDRRRLCAEEERGAVSRVKVKETRHAELLAGLSGYLSAHDQAEPTDAASARSGVNGLVDRDTAYRAAQRDEESADRSLVQLDREVAEIRELIEGIFRKAGVKLDDRAELTRRIESLDRYNELENQRNAVTLAVESARGRLDEAGEAALAERDADALRSEADELARQDGEFVGLQEEIQGIRAEVRLARTGHDLEELIANRSAALDTLREKRDEALLSHAGEFLIELVRNEHETTQAPRVLERARELFGRFTHHAYQLIVPSDQEASFRAIDARTFESKRPDELSGGTRAQLLLAVRLAFAEDAEQGTPLPIFLDEALDPSDPVRFKAIVQSLGRMAADGDRQFIYLTADPADVTRIQTALNAEGCNAARVIELEEVRKWSAAVARSDDLQIPPLPRIPGPGGRSAPEYGAVLGVPAFDPRRGFAAQHLFYLVWDDLDLLHRMLERRIQHVGQWRMVSAAGSAVAEQLASASSIGGQLASRVDLLDDFCRLWSEGRGRPVDRDALDASGAVTATFLERVVEVAAELAGDPKALIEAMRSRRDERLSGYRSQAADNLEAFLVEEGHIDRRPILDEDELCARVMASPAAARLPGDLAADCVHRWWTLSES